MNDFRPIHPPTRTLGEVAGRLGAPAAGESAVQLHGLTLASAAVRPGDLFVALRGANAHGASFIPAALEAGAAAVMTDDDGASLLPADVPKVVVPDPRSRVGPLAAWFYDYPARAVRTVGITGTTGKTTVSYLVEAAMRAAWGSTALLGTIETRLGGQSASSVRTTLEAPALQAAFALMRERGTAGAALEISSHAIALHRVDGLALDVAVFTNLSREHLDFHRDMDAYFKVKAGLFTPAHAARAVVDADSDWGRRIAAESQIPVITAGLKEGAQWRIVPQAVELDGETASQGFILQGSDGRAVRGSTRMIGDFNVVNAALALLAAIEVGIDPETAARGIAELDAVPGRMEAVPRPAGAPLGIVDFAHTPDAIQASLRALGKSGAGRIIAVLGAGGERDQGKRPLMGAAAAARADLVIVTDDNPRREDPGEIRAAILAGTGTGRAQVREVPGRAAAIRAAVGAATGADTIAVLGKGHERSLTGPDGAQPWDDREALAQAIEEGGPWR